MIGTITETSYTDSKVSQGSTYYYKISCVNDEGEGPLSSAFRADMPTALLKYDFNETRGNIVHDSSGHGFDGIQNGGGRWTEGKNVDGMDLELQAI